MLLKWIDCPCTTLFIVTLQLRNINCLKLCTIHEDMFSKFALDWTCWERDIKVIISFTMQKRQKPYFKKIATSARRKLIVALLFATNCSCYSLFIRTLQVRNKNCSKLSTILEDTFSKFALDCNGLFMLYFKNWNITTEKHN